MEVFAPVSDGIRVSPSLLYGLSSQVSGIQSLFVQTGGSHAVALFSSSGTLVRLCEDAGRHNAMDKLLGYMLKRKQIPLRNHIVWFSGRLSYELVQKALAAGIPVLCSVGAPSSMAISLVSDYRITLVGFLKNEKMNVYCGHERLTA